MNEGYATQRTALIARARRSSVVTLAIAASRVCLCVSFWRSVIEILIDSFWITVMVSYLRRITELIYQSKSLTAVSAIRLNAKKLLILRTKFSFVFHSK